MRVRVQMCMLARMLAFVCARACMITRAHLLVRACVCVCMCMLVFLRVVCFNGTQKRSVILVYACDRNRSTASQMSVLDSSGQKVIQEVGPSLVRQ